MTATLLADRAVLRLSPLEPGEDVAGFLQGLVTNDVTGALPVYAGLLSAQGKTMFDFLVWRAGDDLLIDCEAAQVEALARRLTLYRLRRKIGIARDPSLAVHWSETGSDDGTRGVPDPRHPALGFRWIAPDTGGASADAGWRAHRLSRGVCEGAEELGDVLWLETNAADLNGVSFTKGCYVGQENTARMNWRQKVNRRLIVVPLERSDARRRKMAYPDLGLAVDHTRVEDISGDAQREWMSL